jgi:hypothetical protein
MDILKPKAVSGEISWQRYHSQPTRYWRGKVSWRIVALYCRVCRPWSHVWMALRKNTFDRIFYRRFRPYNRANHLAIIEDANRTALERQINRAVSIRQNALPRAGLFPF